MKKLVVITGASSGIGMALAQKFSDEGHPLLLLARRLAPMENMRLPDSVCQSVDVRDLQAVKQAIASAEKRYGKTDLLINCAGVMLLGNAPVQHFSEWEEMIDINIKGVLTGTHAVLADMVKRQEGTIINISSIAGRKTFDHHAAYCGTKYAVHAISESLRKEIAHTNVRIIVVAPGVVETELLSHTSNDTIKQDYQAWKATIGGGLSPRQIVDCVWFAYQMPQDVCVREIVIAKTRQAD